MIQEQSVSLLSPQDIPAFIRKTFDHYFGNYNYTKDNFLQEQAKAGIDGWVDLSIFEKFKKVSEYVKSEELRPYVFEGLKDGKYFIFDEEKKAVKRNPNIPLPESSILYWQGCKNRTAFFKGFPLDATLDEIINYCEKYGVVENVSKHTNHQTKEFKGSVFTIYETVEEMQKALEGDDKFGEHEIKRTSREEYMKEIAEENKKKKEEAKSMKENKNKAVEDAVNTPTFKSGNVLALTGLPEKVNLNDIKTYFKKFGDCAFVQLEEDGKAKVRFAGDTENIAKEVLEKALKDGEGKLALFAENGNVEASVLTSDEEKEYWKSYYHHINTNKKGNGNFKRNKKNGGRGNYSRNGRDRNGEDENKSQNNKRKNQNESEVEEKKSKVEESETKEKEVHVGDN
ncbi:Lupus La protein [Strongyloides ratti]|uniref:Lupus La protein n=1 Tax=Strongyloides ratti TaxID=34506 RepID=A0A090MXL2_STRRB|nr:Lupus La protein [Strongyloides ratti]CEF65629.1 Lupus La protein [Strongyloides ratti]